MCGIHGIFSKNLSKEQITKRLELMGATQRHRGPDDKREEVYSTINGMLGFGFVRLSIIDLETGMQPITSPIDGTTIICNGQIYNYVELKEQIRDERFLTKGDIEVALHLYRRLGPDFLNRLNGMYAGAVYDPLRNILLLFRDRFGIKPLYYTEHQGDFIFSSEIKPILKGNLIAPQLNADRLPTLLTYRYVPGEETMFKGIRKVPPGSFLEYDLSNGTSRVKRYWEFLPGQDEHPSTLDEASGNFIELFKDAVKIRLRSDVEVGTFLSGGIDSSAVTSQAAFYKPDIKLFTISFQEKPYNELPSVNRFIDNNRHRFSEVRHYHNEVTMQSLSDLPGIIRSIEEPVFLGAVLPTDKICKLGSEHLKVVLTGEGADEIFAGYRKFFLETAAAEYPRLPLEKQKDLENFLPELVPYLKIRDKDPLKRYIQSEELFSREELLYLTGMNPQGNMFPEDALPGLNGREHPLNTALAMECRFRLPDYVILRLDKLAMRYSLEARTPFLDYRLAEFAARLPFDLKIDLERKREKQICRYSFQKYGILDTETTGRPKLPFTSPIADWLSEPERLPDMIKDIYYGDIVQKQGILDYRTVQNLVKGFSAKGIGPSTLVSGADRIFAVIVFTLWYSEFFMQGN